MKNKIHIILIIIFSLVVFRGERNLATEAYDGVSLKVMRLNVGGIAPEFNKDITEYYLVVDTSVSEILITAMPENSEDNINITGNTNLKNGLNKIAIEVTKKDGSKNRIYTINVTRTEEVDKSNTSLEILAIEYFTLEPEFSANVTNYKARVESFLDRVNVLAIPENYLAKVDIKNAENLNFGENIVTVIVTAENGITLREYEIKVYRQNPEEDENKREEQAKNAERLADITVMKNAKRLSIQTEEKEDKNYLAGILTVFLFVILAIVIAYVAIINKRIKNFNKKK